jgi:cytochrome oxidase assembly protein ShyY1
VDNGFFIPVNRLAFNSINFNQTGASTLQGVWAEVPVRKGLLGGPDTTTATNILAYLNPRAVHPRANAQRYFINLNPNSSLFVSRPATANPNKHFGYMVQWLIMAFVFPILCWRAWQNKAA